MKVALLQLSPVLGDREASIAKAEALLEPLSREDGIDLLVLPEMALTGYTFADRAAVEPLLEPAEPGSPTFDWCRGLTQRLGCAVVCGFPERRGEAALNSVLVLDAAGALVESVAKHFLFETDKTWAAEGPEFRSVQLCGRTAALGICMDVNPREFEAPFEAFEFGCFARDCGADLVVLACAWTDSTPECDSDMMDTVNYWATRLSPLIGRPVEVVVADRVGREGETTFVGSSCALRLGPEAPEVLGVLGKREEGVMLVSLGE